VTARNGATIEGKRPGRGRSDALDKALGAAGGHAVAVLAEGGPDERDVAHARGESHWKALWRERRRRRRRS